MWCSVKCVGGGGGGGGTVGSRSRSVPWLAYRSTGARVTLASAGGGTCTLTPTPPSHCTFFLTDIMSGLTKEQLRNELVIHGVELPSSGARKEEYLQLYEKYVAPVEQSKGDFSSDDEDIVANAVDTKVSCC